MRKALCASAVLCAALACGCSPVYVFKAWRGHARLLSARRPVDAVLADPATPPAVRAKLELVRALRRFAFERMALPPTRNYTDYVAVRGPAVSWVVSASRKTRLEAKTWWFPFVGRVPYLGYFDRRDAEAEREALERRDLDAASGGVAAFSTLRWFKDPVVSTMLEGGAGEVAELLLHELTHTAVFFKGSVDFDEALATFFGEQGASEFLAERFGPASAELAAYRELGRRRAERTATLDRLTKELEALYSGPAPDAEKLERREAVFERYREMLGLERLNNATVLAHRRYRCDLQDFQRAYERLGRDWRKTLERMRSLDRRKPRLDLKAWLAAPAR